MSVRLSRDVLKTEGALKGAGYVHDDDDDDDED